MEDCGRSTTQPWKPQGLPPSRSCCPLLHPHPSPANLPSLVPFTLRGLSFSHTRMETAAGVLSPLRPGLGQWLLWEGVSSSAPLPFLYFVLVGRGPCSQRLRGASPAQRGGLPAQPGVWPRLPAGLTGGSILCSPTRNKGAVWGDISFTLCLVSHWKSWASTQERLALFPSPPTTP